MSDYGRNFEFRKTPKANARDGRFMTQAALAAIPIGAPVVTDLSQPRDPGLDLQPVKLAPNGLTQDDGVATGGGSVGIAVYEFGPAAFAGDDPYLTTYSDKDVIPPGRALQVIRGDTGVSVCFTNTFNRKFLGIRAYAGRIMVNGLGATPTVAEGDFLVPYLGDDADGYWASTGTAAGAWMEITKVDSVRNQVEARLLF